MMKHGMVMLAALGCLAVNGWAQAPKATSAQGAATAQPAAQPQLQMHTLDSATQADPFPAINPANFTADSPSVATVDGYLRAMLGYDANRIWRVIAIQKTQAAGVSRVTALISERATNVKTLRTSFFVLPDGKHLIAPDGAGVNGFGVKPFEEAREKIRARSAGPAKGAATKDLMLVEFADLQCPKCKEAQATMTRLAEDFPKARIVYESLPLTDVHPYAMQAALYGACVAKKSSDAFFTYANAVYDQQAALVPATADATLKAAVTKAGMDASAVALCSATAAAKSDVAASTALAADLGVEQTPTLSVNGRLLPLSGLAYETLKALIIFQAGNDGVAGGAPATGLTLQQR